MAAFRVQQLFSSIYITSLLLKEPIFYNFNKDGSFYQIRF